MTLSVEIERVAKAFTGLMPAFTVSRPRVLARHPNGVVEMRFEMLDGSYFAVALRVPPGGAMTRKLDVKDVFGWHAPTETWVGFSPDLGLQHKQIISLLAMLNMRREAVMEALGPTARGVEWWTDVEP